jgi:GT2 family glycosyltransferase
VEDRFGSSGTCAHDPPTRKKEKIVPLTVTPTPFVTVICAVAPGAKETSFHLLDALREQTLENWQLVISGELAGKVAIEEDPRIRVVAGAPNRAAALSIALAAASGDYIAAAELGDYLDRDALSLLAKTVRDGVDADIIYSDETIGGKRFSKPSFSPERLRGQFYLGNFTIYRRSLLTAVGGFREGIDGAELYDLALRASVDANAVHHLDHDLFTGGAASAWGIAVGEQLAATRAVLEHHLSATGGGVVDAVYSTGLATTRRAVDGEPLVSIVIPTRGDRAKLHGADRCMVVEAVRSACELSTYKNIEFVVVIDEVAPQGLYTELRAIAGDRVRFVPWLRAFSFSEKMNLGVLHAKGEFILLLNDDVEVISPHWIESMLGLAQRPNAGMVGAMLYFEDDTIQHAGHAYRKLDVTHIGLFSPRGSAGPFGGFFLEREVAGVTAACGMVRKSVFLEAGGFSTLLPGNFNDVDLCMKLNVLGYQSYLTPNAELYHFESKSRDPRVSYNEIRITWGRWEDFFWDSALWPTDPHEIFPVAPLG